MRSHKSLLANASHELRSPLTRIRMGLELMGEKPSPNAKAEIARNIGELDQLIDEILLSSRLDSKEADMGTIETVDLTGLAAEECARVDAELDVSPQTDGSVRGVPRLLRRAVRNLLENARRYGAGSDIAVRSQRVATTPCWPSTTAAPACRCRCANASSNRSTDCPAPASAKAASAWGWRWSSRSSSGMAARCAAKTAKAAAPASSSRFHAAEYPSSAAGVTHAARLPRQGRIAAMFRTKMVRYAAMAWGFTVFMPVGVTWAAAFMMLLALLFSGDLRERASRVRHSALWWPLVAYVVWTLVVLALRPHYPETPSNLVHGLRIAFTVAMALALTADEALWGLRAFVAIALFNLLYIPVFYLFLMRWGVWLPMPDVIRGVIMLVGNKSISNALLFTMFGAAAAAFGLARLAEYKPYRAVGYLALWRRLQSSRSTCPRAPRCWRC